MVVFKNKGNIPIKAVTTFGVSVKEEGAIGYFGTGLKMAISVILRNCGNITVYSGETEYKFTTENESIRGKDFNMVCMNGVQLGFTTENARNWEMWMAVRELYCNCGEDYIGNSVSPAEGETHIVVEDTDFESAYSNRVEFILSGKRLLWSNGKLEIYAGATDKLFYKGIKVHTARRPYCFTYNVLESLELTEDRTIASEFSTHWEVSRNVVECDVKAIINTICSCGEGYSEYYFNFSDG